MTPEVVDSEKKTKCFKKCQKTATVAKSAKNCIPDEVDVHRKLVKVTQYRQEGQCWLVLAQGFWIGVWMNYSPPNVQVGTLILGVLNCDLHRLGTVDFGAPQVLFV